MLEMVLKGNLCNVCMLRLRLLFVFVCRYKLVQRLVQCLTDAGSSQEDG